MNVSKYIKSEKDFSWNLDKKQTSSFSSKKNPGLSYKSGY